MKVLVIGGTGFLGSEIATKFQADGKIVRSLNRSFSPALNIEQFIGDISQPDSYKKLITQWEPEVVIQSAWVTEQESYRDNPSNKLYAQNTLELAEHCFQADTKHFIALGSSAEYGFPKEPCNASSTRTNPQDIYGSYKLWASERLRELADEYSRKISWVRIFQPYGPNQDSTRLIPFAANKLAANETISINNPNTVLDWITSRDVANALAYTVDHDLPEIIDIGTSIGTPVIEMLRKVALLVDADPSLILDNSSANTTPDPYELVVSKNSPLFESGWKPQDSLTTGLSWALSL